MEIKKKIAIAGVAVLPLIGIGGIAYASTANGTPTTTVHHSVGGRVAADTETAGAAGTTADAPGGANVQQGPDVQQGGPDTGPAAEVQGVEKVAAGTTADAPGGANVQQGPDVQQGGADVQGGGAA